ncbi:hypothetical protein XI03_21050 [Bradyrhizobium sp. CCBAU 65884]|uniref:ATP-binding protein n=1 Tax=Bradyrhizobium sp. CCBAU 65884 TaxID=722477 RepID=UPI002305B727|nr:ATP-binding protein [Bradyrhizobium sp. CCBAU 65884]MDA9476928.1 hypothetical protein [Bradyrhizobium sp. CCBAU 65884]
MSSTSSGLGYYDFFARGKQASSDWDNPIGRPRAEDMRSGKLGQLHRDVFDHHHLPESIPHYVGKLIVQERDHSRIIALDNLTDYYLNSDLPVDAPIYESADLNADDEIRAGENKITSDEFFSIVTDIPFSAEGVQYGKLGGNRVTYLFGSVGTGKTFLCARLIAKLQRSPQDADGFTVVPIRVCFESLSRSKIFDIGVDEGEVGKGFYAHLLAEIDKHTARIHKGAIASPEISKQWTEQQVYAAIQKHLVRLAEQHLRVFLIFDNIDGFHYRYSRIIFFDEKYQAFLKKLNRNIVKLCNSVTDEALLGNAGLCCLVVARENVARDFIPSLADPDRQIFEDHRTFWLGEVDPKKIIESRYKLLDVAAKAIVRHGLTISGTGPRTFEDALVIIREKILSSASDVTEGLGVIWGMCHHGHRSLVDFLSKLKINYYLHREIHERLLGDSPHYLERLYITNMKRRYAQSKNHFPNLFLCDSWINPENISEGVQCDHYHSYWLKYLILKFVLEKEVRNVPVTGQEVINFFVNTLAYEDRFVRICLGSLCMVTESRCLEMDGPRDVAPTDRRLMLTSRGRILIDGAQRRNRNPYCFELSYLQLVTDDFWLALPKWALDEIFVEANLSYTFELGKRYQAGVSEYLSKKIFAAITFLRVLEASWDYEEKRCGDDSLLKPFKPDFSTIFDQLENLIVALITKGFSGTIRHEGRSIAPEDVRSFFNKVRNDKTFSEFFEAVWKSRCKVLSPE